MRLFRAGFGGVGRRRRLGLRLDFLRYGNRRGCTFCGGLRRPITDRLGGSFQRGGSLNRFRRLFRNRFDDCCRLPVTARGVGASGSGGADETFRIHTDRLVPRLFPDVVCQGPQAEPIASPALVLRFGLIGKVEVLEFALAVTAFNFLLSSSVSFP